MESTLRCPRCKSTEHLQVERRVDGDIKCMQCDFKDKYSVFVIGPQYINGIAEVLKKFNAIDIRVGQLFKMIDLKLQQNGKDIFYISDAEILKELEELLPD